MNGTAGGEHWQYDYLCELSYHLFLMRAVLEEIVKRQTTSFFTLFVARKALFPFGLRM
jgi:hypothetical protein